MPAESSLLPRPRAVIVAVAVLLALFAGGTLTGCSSASKVVDKQSAAPAPKADPQTQFLIDAAARHAAAIDLLDLTSDRPISDKLKQFVAQARQDRSGQVLVLATAVQQRGFTMPSPDENEAGDGLITRTELDRIAALGDAEFQKWWVESMTTLNEGVIAFVEADTAARKDPATAKVAADLKKAMRTELKKLQAFKS